MQCLIEGSVRNDCGDTLHISLEVSRGILEVYVAELHCNLIHFDNNKIYTSLLLNGEDMLLSSFPFNLKTASDLGGLHEILIE